METPDLDELLKHIRAEAKTFVIFSPINLAEERNKFLQSKINNPRFIYPNYPKLMFKGYLDTLKKVKSTNSKTFKNKIWNNRLIETNLKLELFLSRGNPYKITTVSEKLYRLTFAKGYLKKAEKDSRLNTGFNHKEHLSPHQTREEIKKYLKNSYGFRGWKIIIQKDADFYTQIRYKKKLIAINDEMNWEFTTLDSMLAHEVDGHILRAFNTLRQKDPLFQNPLPFYIKTEEGLASYLGDFCADGGDISLKHHAIKYLAGYLALNNSFREVFTFLTDCGLGPELAFQRTFRIKRGLTDTSAPGCFAREAIYYEGLMDVKKYIESKGNIKKIFAAKAAIEDSGDVVYPPKMLVPGRIKNS